MVTAVIAVLAAASTGVERYVRGIFIRRQGISQGGAVLIGVLGSKNAMGSLCALTITSSITVFLSQAQPKLLRQASIFVGGLGLLILLRTFATGAALSVAIFVAVFSGLACATRMSPSARFLGFLAVFAILAPLWFIRGDIEAGYNWFITDVLNKDAGLTGRAYLWHHADILIEAKPILGHGYRSIWMGNSAETIGLLRWAKLPSGIGFNFHNTFKECLVDFGYVGAAAIFITLGIGLFHMVQQAVKSPLRVEVIFLAAMGIVTVIRSYTENQIGAFSEGSLLTFGVSAFGFMFWAARQTRTSRSRGQIPLRPVSEPAQPMRTR
ncbi:hypothetical protein LTR94_024633 [Friedmanniomyces endolithicus]|nr:hypothetical protein LTR94_024633 [Friedmanniomyces endolithicus]